MRAFLHACLPAAVLVAYLVPGACSSKQKFLSDMPAAEAIARDALVEGGYSLKDRSVSEVSQPRLLGGDRYTVTFRGRGGVTMAVDVDVASGRYGFAEPRPNAPESGASDE